MTALFQLSTLVLAISLFTGAPLWLYSALIIAIAYSLAVSTKVLAGIAVALLIFNISFKYE